MREPITPWPLPPLLVDSSGGPITSLAAWQARAAEIRATFLATLGEKPASQKLQRIETGATEIFAGLRHTTLTLHVDDDDAMDALLIEPLNPPARRRVGIALHGTSAGAKEEVAGMRGRADMAYGRELALRGWTMLVPDHFALKRRYARDLDEYRTDYFYDRFPKWSAVGKFISDGQACIDALEQLPQTRGCPPIVIGHSLGGHSSLFLGALDARVAATVNNCGTAPFSDNDARAHWFRERGYIYLTDKALKASVIQGPQPLWDMHQVAALLAPRPLFILAASNDECGASPDGNGQMFSELHRVYNLLDAPARLATVLHNEKHAFTAPWREAVYAWLERCVPAAGGGHSEARAASGEAFATSGTP